MLTLITPTSGRPEAFSLLERWIASQTYGASFEWIVAVENDQNYKFNLYQKIIRTSPKRRIHSLANNLAEALKIANGDNILIIEDDDYYAPDYIQFVADALSDYSLVGVTPAHYYHVGRQRFRYFANKAHASLAQTAFSRDLIRFVLEICKRGRPFIDRELWGLYQGKKGFIKNENIHVSIKGMPGTRGIGAGHNPMMGQPDHKLEIFNAWQIPEIHERSDMRYPTTGFDFWHRDMRYSSQSGRIAKTSECVQ